MLSSLAILLAAGAIRAALLFVAVDVPGDGPVRAFQAYQWSRSPYWIDHGMWLPGGLYFSGLASIIVPSPAVAVRLLNVASGALTASVAFALMRQLYGPRTAWLAGLGIAVFPLHATLSASSLSEPWFLFLIVLTEFVVTRHSGLAGKASPRGALVLGLGLVVLAEMTRYEAWVLAPIFGAFVWFRTHRSWRSAIVVGALLIAFPILWCVENLIHLGDPLYGLSMARSSVLGSFGPGLFGLSDSVPRIVRAAAANLGVPLLLLVAGGFLLEIRSLARREADAARAFHLALSAAFWLFAVGLAMVRGPKLYNRYLVLGFVLSLPFAGIALERISRRRTAIWIPALCVVLVATVAWAGRIPVVRPLSLTRQRPFAVMELTRWLSRSDHMTHPILLVNLRSHATYFFQYGPDLRWEVFDYGEEEVTFRRRIEALHRPLFVVRRVDRDALAQRLQAWAPQLAQLQTIRESEGLVLAASRPAARPNGSAPRKP